MVSTCIIYGILITSDIIQKYFPYNKYPSLWQEFDGDYIPVLDSYNIFKDRINLMNGIECYSTEFEFENTTIYLDINKLNHYSDNMSSDSFIIDIKMAECTFTYSSICYIPFPNESHKVLINDFINKNPMFKDLSISLYSYAHS